MQVVLYRLSEGMAILRIKDKVPVNILELGCIGKALFSPGRRLGYSARLNSDILFS